MPKYPKPRPNIPFDGTTCTRYDNGYYKNKVVFSILHGRDLWIKFCSTHAPKKTLQVFWIDDFADYAAFEVINNINDFNATRGTKTSGEWGRHFEDGILQIWHNLNLPFYEHYKKWFV